MDPFSILIIVAVIFLVFLFLWLVPLGLWFNALLNGVRISLLQLILMRWRKVPPSIIVNGLITGTKAGIKLNRDEIGRAHV